MMDSDNPYLQYTDVPEDRVFVVPDDDKECYCNTDVTGVGYTYNDEYGSCMVCEDKIQCNHCNQDFRDKEEVKEEVKSCPICKEVKIKYV